MPKTFTCAKVSKKMFFQKSYFQHFHLLFVCFTAICPKQKKKLIMPNFFLFAQLIESLFSLLQWKSIKTIADHKTAPLHLLLRKSVKFQQNNHFSKEEELREFFCLKLKWHFSIVFFGGHWIFVMNVFYCRR